MLENREDSKVTITPEKQTVRAKIKHIFCCFCQCCNG